MSKGDFENHTLKVNGKEYRITHDDYTGDWCVESMPLIQGEYVLTKRGAIDLVLERAGVIDDGEYRRAPDRC